MDNNNKKLFPGVSQWETDRERAWREGADAIIERDLSYAETEEEKARILRDAPLFRKTFEHDQLYRKYGAQTTKERDIHKRGKVYDAIAGISVCVATIAFALGTWATGAIEEEKRFFVNGREDVQELEDMFDEEIALLNNVQNGVIIGFVALFFLSMCALLGAKVRNEFLKNEKHLAVSMMLQIKKQYPNVNIDEKKLERLLKTVPEIISRMSAAEAVYFKMLIDGHLEIMENKTFRDMAVAIMEGWLQRHPKDMELVLATFDRDSIPQELMQKYGPVENYGR